MICKTCHGRGHLVTFATSIEFWKCPACGGTGTRYLHQHPFVNNRAKALKVRRSEQA